MKPCPRSTTISVMINHNYVRICVMFSPTASAGGIGLRWRHTMKGTNRIPTLFLICGLPGSGKTTLAKQIEREQPALYFSEDEWMLRLYAAKDGGDGAKRELVKCVQWETVERALRL